MARVLELSPTRLQWNAGRPDGRAGVSRPEDADDDAVNYVRVYPYPTAVIKPSMARECEQAGMANLGGKRRSSRASGGSAVSAVCSLRCLAARLRLLESAAVTLSWETPRSGAPLPGSRAGARNPVECSFLPTTGT
jgi:hypothetical protein